MHRFGKNRIFHQKSHPMIKTFLFIRIKKRFSSMTNYMLVCNFPPEYSTLAQKIKKFSHWPNFRIWPFFAQNPESRSPPEWKIVFIIKLFRFYEVRSTLEICYEVFQEVSFDGCLGAPWVLRKKVFSSVKFFLALVNKLFYLCTDSSDFWICSSSTQRKSTHKSRNP